MYCFYHKADFDGKCSAFIVRKYFKEDFSRKEDCVLVGVNYGEEEKIWKYLDLMDTKTPILMVDFSIQPFSEMYNRLISKFPHFVWIDHHKSAIEAHHNHGGRVGGLRRVGIGACQLCWEYFYPGKNIPLFIKLLAEYDVWNHSDPRTVPFQYGLRYERNTSPYNTKLWESLFNEENVNKIVDRGKIIYEWEKRSNEKYVKSYSFEVEFEGLKCIACIRGGANSSLFDSIWDESKYDVMMLLSYNGNTKLWTVSLYSTKEGIDVSKIAEKYGGGGHKGAAGFQCARLMLLEG